MPRALAAGAASLDGDRALLHSVQLAFLLSLLLLERAGLALLIGGIGIDILKVLLQRRAALVGLALGPAEKPALRRITRCFAGSQQQCGAEEKENEAMHGGGIVRCD